MTDVTVTRSDGSWYIIHDPSVYDGSRIDTLLDGDTRITLRRNRDGGMRVAKKRRYRTECRRGHARNENNTTIDKRGYYKCRICERNRQAIKKENDASKKSVHK